MYYPKSKIIPNQYTSGRELVYKTTNTEYVGYYYILADGTVYSGKNPNDGNPRQLVYITNRTDQPVDEPGVFQASPTSVFRAYDLGVSKLPYDSIRLNITKTLPPIELIEPYYVQPNVQYPSFIRYFVKRTNNTIYIEIDSTQYNRFVGKDKLVNWPIYTPFEIPWTTGGSSLSDIESTNRKIVLLTQQRLNLTGLTQYITNYREFAI